MGLGFIGFVSFRFEIYVFYYVLGLQTMMALFNKKLIILVHSIVNILIVRSISLENLIIFDKIIRLIQKRANKLIFLQICNFKRRFLFPLIFLDLHFLNEL